MTRTSRRVTWWIIDRVFPIIEPLSSEQRLAMERRQAGELAECKVRAAGLSEDLDTSELAAACRTMLDDEQKRQQSIDNRLTTIIGLSSIAGTVVFGTLLTTIPRARSTLSSLLLLSLGYLIVQLACAMFAAVRGLERRAYSAVRFSEVLPVAGESQRSYHRRQVEQFVEIFLQNQEQNNAKLTFMAVAHCALKNFIGGLLIFAVLAGVHHVVEQPSDELLIRLKTDRALRDLLRGPQGPAGATGPQGPVGPAGPTGPQERARRENARP